MKVSLLDLITTPVPVLNSLGVNTRVGLSSDDPMALRHHSEGYQAYLTVYSPEGLFLERRHLGEIPANSRRFFDLSTVTRELVPSGDHLTVVHRVPDRLLDQVASVDEPLGMKAPPDYFGYRSCLEYSFPQGANGSVIYETPPRLNTPRVGRPPSDSLTFSSKLVLSEAVNTDIVLIHYSLDPAYTTVCDYHFSIFSAAGELMVSDEVRIAPFSIHIINVGQTISQEEFQRQVDPTDGLAVFTFVGFTENASVIPLFVNSSSSLGAISVEHSNPAQEYVITPNFDDRRTVKSDAVKQWAAGSRFKQDVSVATD